MVHLSLYERVSMFALSSRRGSVTFFHRFDYRLNFHRSGSLGICRMQGVAVCLMLAPKKWANCWDISVTMNVCGDEIFLVKW